MPRPGLVIGQIGRIGGMEKQAALLSRELNKRGMKVTLFVSGSRASSVRSDFLALDSIAPKHLFHSRHTHWLSKRLLGFYCRWLRITHLIAFNVENAEIAVAANIEGKVTMNVRGTRFSTDIVLGKRHKDTARRCDLLTTNSAATAGMLEELGIADSSRIQVIHNGIELPAVELSPKGKVVLYVGSIKEVKDPMTFARACRDVIRIDGDVRIVMAGDGNLRPEVERYIDDNGLRHNFTLLGEVPYEEIPYEEASVFVNSSLRESSCNSLLEALSFGVPVVATDNPGNRDMLSELDHHELVPIANSEKMAEAIHSLLGAGQARKEAIFEESRNLIREQYSVSRMVDDYIESFLSS